MMLKSLAVKRSEPPPVPERPNDERPDRSPPSAAALYPLLVAWFASPTIT